MHKPSAPGLSLIAAALLLAACNRSTVEPAAAASGPGSAEFRKAMEDRQREIEKDELVVEAAPWFGRTGLSDEIERELPRYLRRELGQRLSEKGAVQASDLEYVGVYTEGPEVVHYWRVPVAAKEPVYAYVVASPPERRVTGWGGRRPRP